MTKNYFGLTLIIIVIAALLAIFNSAFIVDQRQVALVIQFGEPIKQIDTPGLKFKIPFIQNVFFFDKRIQNLKSEPTEVIASDQKNMRVDSFGKYRIKEALTFYQTVQTEEKLKSRLSSILDSNLRQVLGSVPFKALLSPQRPELMKKICDLVNTEANSLGVEMVDVRIMRADLPEKSREAVYQRMKTDRLKEAKEIRAQGDEQAQIIKATADKEKKIILAEAQKRAQMLRGEGDGEAIKAFSSSFSRDPQFYEFYRTLQAYKKSINKDNTKLILSPDGEFMKFFGKAN
ncbi:Hflc protein [endosymbiont of Acanthamoeba sp. UWC8]|uniref:protease modulator HflC n=1 Tax=endosymbiont of Acanthamoeba sp. UWC8 TaxID=86106 RepID=UPI0004D1D751|nr:protease modulator HflC [endosymbiont of Acanthamoeba sp. UWC8]AIF81065.1 Hflc protein [endosymbiont of Acanthamoeba sp. UWC8]